MKNPLAYLKGLRKKLKDPYWRAKCDYIKYYEKLPIEENVILLEAQNATKVDGNIFYILKYITSSEKYSTYKIYVSSWIRYKKKIRAVFEQEKMENVNLVVYSSDEYVRLLASAKFLITDNTFPNYYIKKKGQIYLNTWHGTPLKTLGKQIHNDIAIGNAQKNMVIADYLLYPNYFTKEVMIRDYMLENIAEGSSILCGYPRNEIFFDPERRELVREEMELQEKRVYAYMPTWRGTVAKIGSNKNDSYLMYYLYELDKYLNEDEILYINLHPMATHAKNNVEIKSLKHIKKFPEKYETYCFLNIVDVLITDYSSVFFDFVCTGKKIVLFPYDKEEYLESRGMYLSLEDLPFPQVRDVPSLLEELRTEKKYEDTEFRKKFNAFDGKHVSQRLCDYVILGEETQLEVEPIPDNGKENVLLYAGNLAKNGITTSIRNLMNTMDLSKRNYYLSFCQGKAKNHAAQLATFHPDVKFFAIAEFLDLTIWERVLRKLFQKKMLSAETFMKYMGNRAYQNLMRAYGTTKFHTAIHFSGYEDEMILLYSAFPGSKAIFVHNDMVNEIKIRHNQRRDVLKYAYNQFHSVVTVTEDIIPPTVELSGKQDNMVSVHNTIDYKNILERAEMPIILDKTTKCSVSYDYFNEVMDSDLPKFITIGRFSPEKGQERLVNAFGKMLAEDRKAYLIIMGGNSLKDGYKNLCAKVKAMGLEEHVILLLSVSNPYPILKACDYFILSSFYEGFGLVIAEADILGKPVVSTDVVGPRGFMTKYGGTLVESSEEGIYQGLKMLYHGEVKRMHIDYEAYNCQCVEEFESLF